MKKKVAIVPVRKGSKGLTDKNTKLLCGKPLYLHAVEQGLRTSDFVILSTDIKSILSKSFCSRVIIHKRPANLALDDTAMAEVILDILGQYALDQAIILLLQATSPLRKDKHIKKALSLYEINNPDLVMSVCEKDNSVLKWGTLCNNSFLPISNKKYCFENRQSLPSVYAPNGAIYIFSGEVFLEKKGFPNDNIFPMIMCAESSKDIDTKNDFDFVEQVLKNSAKWIK